MSLGARNLQTSRRVPLMYMYEHELSHPHAEAPVFPRTHAVCGMVMYNIPVSECTYTPAS